jgi:hypothetical protein
VSPTSIDSVRGPVTTAVSPSGWRTEKRACRSMCGWSANHQSVTTKLFTVTAEAAGSSRLVTHRSYGSSCSPLPTRSLRDHLPCGRHDALAFSDCVKTVSQPFRLGALEICLSEEQTPQVVFSKKRSEREERLERAFVRPRQVLPASNVYESFWLGEVNSPSLNVPSGDTIDNQNKYITETSASIRRPIEGGVHLPCNISEV